MRRLLLRAWPPGWRARYGDELLDLLEGSPVTTGIVVDIVRAAAAARVRVHPRRYRAALAVVLFTLADAFAVRIGVTENILWAPTTPLRAVVLLTTIAPLAWLGATLVRDRAEGRSGVSR